MSSPSSPSSPSSSPGGPFDVPEALLSSDTNPYKEELLLAVEVALKAGLNIEAHCESVGTSADSESALRISTKSHASDLATAVDLENETLVTEAIRKKFPAHEIVGEEACGANGGAVPALSADDAARTWIVDPIDGTTNFASGLPLSCVSVGLCRGATPVMGVVHAPSTRELYVAVRGLGAYRNGRRLGGVVRRPLRDAVVVHEFGSVRSEKGVDVVVGAVRRTLRHGCRATRSLGSGVLDLCYAASGRVDVVYAGVDEEGWKPWDYCAGSVVVEEAGGVVRPLRREDDNDDGAFDIYSKSMICATHEALLEECRTVVLGEETT